MSNISWHRLFGLTLVDLFTASNFQVELEKELSIKKQFLDIVIIKKVDGIPLLEMPAGLDNLVEHNLLTYKSLQEPLDDWAIEELIGHYVNYRKLVSFSLEELLPFQQFQLYAVSTRYPPPREKSVLNQLYELYKKEGVIMLYTWEDFDRDYTKEHLHLLSVDDITKKIPIKDVIERLSPEERLKDLPLEIIEEYLSKLKKH